MQNIKLLLALIVIFVVIVVGYMLSLITFSGLLEGIIADVLIYLVIESVRRRPPQSLEHRLYNRLSYRLIPRKKKFSPYYSADELSNAHQRLLKRKETLEYARQCLDSFKSNYDLGTRSRDPIKHGLILSEDEKKSFEKATKVSTNALTSAEGESNLTLSKETKNKIRFAIRMLDEL